LWKWQQRAKEEAHSLPPVLLSMTGTMPVRSKGVTALPSSDGGLAHQPGARPSLGIAHQQLVRSARFHRPGRESFALAARQLTGLLVVDGLATRHRSTVVRVLNSHEV
jgi:hypothetical protein